MAWYNDLELLVKICAPIIIVVFTAYNEYMISKELERMNLAKKYRLPLLFNIWGITMFSLATYFNDISFAYPIAGAFLCPFYMRLAVDALKM
jgi:hypothetical protein